MLSKIRYYADNSGDGLAHARATIDPAPALARLGPGGWQAHPAPGGTLGAGFFAVSSEKSLFLKTHAIPEGRKTLRKEFSLLTALYSEALRIQLLQIDGEQADFLWLVTDQLRHPVPDAEPGNVLALIDAYSLALRAANNLPVPPGDDFSLLLREGRKALSNLVRDNLLDMAIEQVSRDAIDLLERQVSRFGRQICHGDLGPRNLMTDGLSLYALDWEDAFWGFEGYDYLYWLTFFSNRKYYSPDMWGQTPWGAETETAVMILILLLKGDLSVKSGTQARNTLPIHQRIAEIAGLGAVTARRF